MDSSTKKFGGSRTSKKGSRGRRNTPAKTSNLGNSWLRNLIRSALHTDDERWSLNINGSLTGIIKSLPELPLSIASSSFEQLVMGICKLSLDGCEGSLILRGNTTKSSPSQGNPHCLMCLYEMLYSRLWELCQDTSGKDHEYYSRCMTQLCVTYKELLKQLKLRQTPVSSSLLPCPHQSQK